jgi:hypothetical protein
MTMTRERTDLGFSDALDDFDPAEWAPKKARSANARSPTTETRRVAAAAGFKSREPQLAPEERVGGVANVRRRRTGRNAQFNLKSRPETIEAFCAIADRQGWGLGETLEHAVAALEDRYGAGTGQK